MLYVGFVVLLFFCISNMEFLILLTIGTRADRGGDKAGGKAGLPKGNVPLSFINSFLFVTFFK